MQHLNTFRRFYMVYFQTALNHQGPKTLFRRFGVPIAVQLNLMCGAQNFGFGEIVADKLHTNRQAVCAETGRQSQCRQTGKVHGDGVNIGQVHLHRIVDVAAKFWRGSWRSRSQNEITLTKGRLKIIGNQTAQFCAFR